MELVTGKLLQGWIEKDREKIVSFLSDLVQCKTPSPPGDTRSAMKLVEKLLNEAGIEYELFPYSKTMPNLVSSLSMTNPGPALMLNGHLDVMPAGKEQGWRYNPWRGEIADEKVWGRGTSDMKAGVTAMLFAYIYASRLKDVLCGKLSLSLVSDEETGHGRGTGYLFKKCPELMEADCVLSAEPSGIDAVSFASKGYVMFEVLIHTGGAIAGYEDQSKNAIEIAARLINKLKVAKLTNVVDSRLESLLRDRKWLKKYIEVRGMSHKDLLSLVTIDLCSINGGTSNSRL